uniref:Helicase-associated domain-containing protein n=1 Tax=Entomoneis paludosa TaxID=265537 RepID=A0A7S2YR94_9STRA|mmetsp:Transcript_6567/g.13726  ORF Transcript_6567/g.13726 Transcript_6567/m.13726 type:complete len:734 (+) Transcript_6567:242-2443(+)
MSEDVKAEETTDLLGQIPAGEADSAKKGSTRRAKDGVKKGSSGKSSKGQDAAEAAAAEENKTKEKEASGKTTSKKKEGSDGNDDLTSLTNLKKAASEMNDAAAAAAASEAESDGKPALMSVNQKKAEDRWMERYQELLTFFEEHGHSKVTASLNKSLANWVVLQRHQLKLFKESPEKPNRMTQARADLLEKVNMEWMPPPKKQEDEKEKNAESRQEIQDKRWMERYKELEEYHAKNGHSKVPQKYPENQSLANWVASQKHLLKLFREMPKGQNSRMNETRAQLLEKVDVEYSRTIKGTSWNERYERLSQLYLEHGERVYVKLNKVDAKLSSWVSAQRHDRKESKLSRDRIEKLDKLNFKWHGSGSKWIDHYHDLVEFHEQNGHSKVPLEYKHRPKLGRWVADQRVAYRLYNEGKKSGMTADKIEKLEKLNFPWALRPRESWMTHYEALCQYRTKHGNCLVPQRHEENLGLGEWVRTQRKQYKLYSEDKNKPGCSITDEKVQLLENINFEWKCKASPEDWMTRYNELGKYLEQHGDCNVPKVYQANRALGNWVQHQRKHYKAFHSNRPTKITEERIQLLERMGFQWQVREGFPKKRSDQQDSPATVTMAKAAAQRTSPARSQRTSPSRARAPVQQQFPQQQYFPNGYGGQEEEEQQQQMFLPDQQEEYDDDEIESDDEPGDEMTDALAQAEREAQEAAAEARRKAKELEILRKRAYESGVHRGSSTKKKTRYSY